VSARRPTDADYARLLAFRTELRRFVRWSEQAAAEHGLTPALHQVLLAVRGAAGEEGPTIGAVADALLVRHHTAVEVAQRAEAAGLLERRRDEQDHRRVHLRLTPAGTRALERISAEHLRNLAPLAARLDALVS
jgi:DNA-binding MarR family transcriptional regulator